MKNVKTKKSDEKNENIIATQLHLVPNIKLIRALANKSQIKFAEILDVKDKNGKYSKDKYYTYENGKTNPPSLFLENLAEYAGVSVYDLINKKLTKEDITIKEKPLAKSDLMSFDVGEAVRKIEVISEVLLSCAAELLSQHREGTTAAILQKQLEAVVNARLNNEEPKQ